MAAQSAQKMMIAFMVYDRSWKAVKSRSLSSVHHIVQQVKRCRQISDRSRLRLYPLGVIVQ